MPLRTPAAARPVRACVACGQALPAGTRKGVLRCRLCAARAAQAFYLVARAAYRDQRRHKADDDS